MACRATLEQLIRCAGDTTPIRVYLMKSETEHYMASELTGITGGLTMIPHIAGTAGSSEPSLYLVGTYGADDDGYAVMTFSFTRSQTVNLAGQYVYQVELLHNNSPSEVRVAQGTIQIKPNVDP